MTSVAEPTTGFDDQLRALAARGFRFLHPRDAHGELTAVVGVRPHGHVIDVVFLYAETEARAVRMGGDTRDIFRPARTLWERTGTAAAVLGAMLALADDAGRVERVARVERTARDNGGCWVPVRPGTTRWLAATA
jgi:hypothetical protein